MQTDTPEILIELSPFFCVAHDQQAKNEKECGFYDLVVGSIPSPPCMVYPESEVIRNELARKAREQCDRWTTVANLAFPYSASLDDLADAMMRLTSFEPLKPVFSNLNLDIDWHAALLS